MRRAIITIEWPNLCALVHRAKASCCALIQTCTTPTLVVAPTFGQMPVEFVGEPGGSFVADAALPARAPSASSGGGPQPDAGAHLKFWSDVGGQVSSYKRTRIRSKMFSSFSGRNNSNNNGINTNNSRCPSTEGGGRKTEKWSPKKAPTNLAVTRQGEGEGKRKGGKREGPKGGQADGSLCTWLADHHKSYHALVSSWWLVIGVLMGYGTHTKTERGNEAWRLP